MNELLKNLVLWTGRTFVLTYEHEGEPRVMTGSVLSTCAHFEQGGQDKQMTWATLETSITFWVDKTRCSYLQYTPRAKQGESKWFLIHRKSINSSEQIPCEVSILLETGLTEV